MDNVHTQCVAKHAHAMHTSDTGVNNNTLRVGLLTRHILIVLKLAVVYLPIVVTSDLIVSIITNPYRNTTSILGSSPVSGIFSHRIDV